MIHKITKLNCIGKFRNYTATGDVTFKKLTLFYADNGSGKTTLTSILRSLTQNEPGIIRLRQSTNLITPQSAQIVQRGTAGDTFHTFNTSGWSNSFPNIEIFDIHFINENIFTGFDFNEEHKKQLHQFVIGAQGVSIHHQIEQNKADKATSKTTQASLEQQILLLVGNNLTTDSITKYLGVTSSPSNITQLIIDAEAALTSASSASIIQTLQNLSPVSKIISGINFTDLQTALAATTETMRDSSLQTLFENHCKDLSDNSIKDPENWLEKGIGYLKAKKSEAENSSLSCPFCQQQINSNIDIINAYSLIFNEIFNKIVKTLEKHFKIIQAFNLEAAIQVVNNINQINSARITSWSTHLPASTSQPVFNIIGNESDLKKELQALIDIVQQKLQNPSQVINDAPLTTLKNSLNIIDFNIDTYNKSVITYNSDITSFRSGIQTVQQAQSEVNRLKCIKERFTPAVAALCSQLTNERQNLKTLEAAYPVLIQQQETIATTFFATYQTKINYYLVTVFKTLFKIENVVNIAPQGRGTQSKLGYKLTIDGQDISFDNSLPNNAKDCLSEGDKSTLALAFFLSKLDVDPTIADKIVIFDDPLSSFDSNRRMYTVQLLTNLYPKVKQLVILSHNELFLHLVSKNFSPGDKKILRITENIIAKESMIEPLDLEKLVENDYFKHVKELEGFLVHADITKKETVLGWMRNVLEAHIRFKFYRQLSHIPPNSRTFGTLITTLDNNSVQFRDDADRVNILQKLRLINGVSCKPHHGEPLPDYTLLGSDPNTMNVVELSHLVQDTLDLIDNKL